MYTGDVSNSTTATPTFPSLSNAQGGGQLASGRKRINPDSVVYANGSKPLPISSGTTNTLGCASGVAAAAGAAGAPAGFKNQAVFLTGETQQEQQHQASPLPLLHIATAATPSEAKTTPPGIPGTAQPSTVALSGDGHRLVPKNVHTALPAAQGAAILNRSLAPIPSSPAALLSATHPEAPCTKRRKAESGQASGGANSGQEPSGSHTTLPQTSAATPAPKCPSSATPSMNQTPYVNISQLVTPHAIFAASPSPLPTPLVLGAEANSRPPPDLSSPGGISSACNTAAAGVQALQAVTTSGAAAAGPMSSSTDASATATPEARLALQELLQQHEVPELHAVLAHELHLPNPVGDRLASRVACKGCGACPACSDPVALTASEVGGRGR